MFYLLKELVEELKARLTKAREAKANAPKDSGGPKEVVILTQTDSKGFTRPVSMSGPAEPSGGRRKGKKVETHSGGKRVRYFADDDKYSLKEMVSTGLMHFPRKVLVIYKITQEVTCINILFLSFFQY